jgi:hypothetical protein
MRRLEMARFESTYGRHAPTQVAATAYFLCMYGDTTSLQYE